jgi:hypothetical protein
VVDGVPEQFVCGGRRLVELVESLAEEESELRPASAELGSWREGQV